jgi:chemotaxis signal transduction protein
MHVENKTITDSNLSRPTADQGNAITDSRELLAFKLVDEEYGMDMPAWRPRHGHHVMAIGSLENRMLILLDIEKLMSSAEMGLVAQTLQ